MGKVIEGSTQTEDVGKVSVLLFEKCVTETFQKCFCVSDICVSNQLQNKHYFLHVFQGNPASFLSKLELKCCCHFLASLPALKFGSRES